MRVLWIFALAAILLFGMGASATFAAGDVDRDQVIRGDRSFIKRDFDRDRFLNRNLFFNRNRFFIRDRFDKEEFDDDFFNFMRFF